MTDQEIKKLAVKAKILGILTEIPTYCNHICHLISKSKTEHILLIPSDVEVLNDYYTFTPFSKQIQNLKGTLKVIGGSGLIDIQRMFRLIRI